MSLFQLFIKKPNASTSWSELVVNEEFGVPQGAPAGTSFSTSLSLKSTRPFQLVPVCEGEIFCVYNDDESFNIPRSKFGDIWTLSQDAVGEYLEHNFDAIGIPSNTIPENIKGDMPPNGNIKVVIEPDSYNVKLIKEALGPGSPDVKYFVYEFVDIRSLYDSFLPNGDIDNGLLHYVNTNPGAVVDPSGDLLDGDEIFRMFLLGLLPPPFIIDDPNNKWNLSRIGEIGIANDSVSPPLRMFRFTVQTNRGPIDPIFLFHRLAQEGYLTDGEGFLTSGVATSLFYYGSDNAGSIISGTHFQQSGVLARETFINELSVRYIYPFSWLRAWRQEFALNNEEWRKVGNHQKELYKHQLPLPGNRSTIFAEMDRHELFNIFLLEAIVENYCWEDVDPYYLPTSIPQWEMNKYYSVGQLVKGIAAVPEVPLGRVHWYYCSQSGLSGGSEPLWLDEDGVIVTDGGVLWKEGGMWGNRGFKKSDVNFLESVDITKERKGDVLETISSDIYLLQIDPFYYLGGQKQNARIVAKSPPKASGTPVGSGESDDYEGVIFLIAEGEVKQIFHQFSSLTSRGNTEKGAASSIEGNRKYLFRSQSSGGKKGINFAFWVTSNITLKATDFDATRVPGWYYWGDIYGHVVGEQDLDPGAEGKGAIMIHRGLNPGSKSGWHGSHGCQVTPSNVFYKFRSSIIDIWQLERKKRGDFADKKVQVIRNHKKKSKSEDLWVASKEHHEWERELDRINKLYVDYDESLSALAEMRARQAAIEGGTGLPESDDPHIRPNNWNLKILGTYYIIRPDEYEEISSGQRKRKLRRRE